MTQKQYKNKMKTEKKELKVDDRVTQEMIDAYNKLKGTMDNAMFPNPIEMLNDKEGQMKKYLQSIMYVKSQIIKEDDIGSYLNNEYTNYITTVYGLDKIEFINKIRNNMKNLS